MTILSDSGRDPAHNLNLPDWHEPGSRELAVFDPYLNPQLPEDEIDLRGIWRIISKYRWSIITIMMVVTITSAFANMLMRPVYQATATIEIKPESQLVRLDNVAAEPPSYWKMANTEMSIIKSKSVAAAVIDELDLWDDPELSGQISQRGIMKGVNRVKGMIFGGVKDLVRQWLPAEQGPNAGQGSNAEQGSSAETQEILSPAERKRRGILGSFTARLSVNAVPDSHLFTISFESFERQMPAEVANAVVEAYKRVSGQRRLGSSEGARDFLEQEISKVQARLETSEKELTEYARKNKIIDLEDSGNILNERLNQLSSQYTAVQGQRIQAETLYRQANAGNIEAIPAVLDRTLIDELKNEYVALESEYLKLTQVFKDTYPSVKAIKAQMTEINRALQSETGKVVQRLELEYTQLSQKEALLKEELEKQKAEMLDLKDRSVQYNILKREWETNRQLYGGLLEKMKEVGVAAGTERSNISVVDNATVPGGAIKPRTGRNVTLASAIGLFLGLGFAFLLAFLDNTFRLTEDMERVLNVPNLGLVPEIDGGRQKPDRSYVGLVAATDRSHELSEAVRTVRTSIQFSKPGSIPKKLLITSATSGEGKSTFASNLAITMAQNGSNVLLVNADLRRPVLHKIYSVPSSPGLSDYLVQTETRIFRRTTIEGLSLVTSGICPPNPTELVGSREMSQFLHDTDKHYDHVIIEAPPLLGLADTMVMTTMVDGVILLVHSGVTSKDAVRESVKRLRSIHAPLLGTVLNMVDTRSHEYGYYNRYYYLDDASKGKGRRIEKAA